MTDINLGKKIIEGKTKIVYKLADDPEKVLLQQKDKITAGDGVRRNDLEGKAAIATETTAAIFNLLNSAGIKTHFVRMHGKDSFVADYCDMIPIEWVARRIATGSFLRRNPGVKEGYRFNLPKVEYFFKDDENHDPQWSYEQLVAASLQFGGREVGSSEVDILTRTTRCVFEILEKSWASLDCALIDMKIEFGVIPTTGELLLADVIDSESWRLWPAGDRRLMVDKQVYRELAEVTAEGLQNVKRNFQWVAERVKSLSQRPAGQVVVMMGSASDSNQGEKVKSVCKSLDIPCHLRVSSAHKGTEETLRILAEYEGSGVSTVFVAIAGRSNGLGPVLSGNATWPVINCPPVTPDWGAQDVWSSLRMPSGLGCATVMAPEAAALHAANILAMKDQVVWSRLRARQLNTWIGLKNTDSKMTADVATKE